MIKCFSSVIDNSHNIRVIMFIVIVKRIKENSKASPLVRTAKNISIIITLVFSEPESLRKSESNTTVFIHLN